MTCNRYHLWAALDVHAFSKAEAVLRFSAEEDGMWVQWQDYARLKAEVDEARRGSGAGMGVMLDLNNQLVAENARLKAEVERLRIAGGESEPRFVFLSDYRHLKAERDTLKAEVERLRRAGDGMEEVIWLNGCLSGMQIKERAVKAWKQAKEGKPSV